MAHDEVTKNHPGGVSDVPSNEKLARMYETSKENDGYKAMKCYIAKLNPKNDAFFQYPKKQWKYVDDIWYDAKPIGVKVLDNMMKSISEVALGYASSNSSAFFVLSKLPACLISR